ncbi:MAG: CinA family protein [Bdellovibrionales bacterium]|nr:CinA family protein [Bdellovibrionales bacterium]
MKANLSLKTPFDRLEIIHAYFMSSQESLCVVESCTGGLLSFWLTALPGASKYFKGGLISYQREVKKRQLGISMQEMKIKGMVTKSFANLMTHSIKSKWLSDWAISTSGVAGPSLGDLGENVGKVAFCVSSPQVQKSALKQFYDIHRQNFQYKASLFALDFLISELS